MAKKQTRVNPAVLKNLVDFMNSPPGGGDMLKSVYDTDNDGKVDQAEEADKLDGQHAAAFAAASHAAAHQNGGADELSVAGLSGELADPQPPKAHTHPGGEITSQVGDAHTVDGSHAADFATSGHNHDSAYAPIAKGVTNGDSHDHVGGDGAAIAEGALSLSDVATGDVSTTKHGFAPKAPNDTSKFLRGDGTWAAPSSSGGLGYAMQGAGANIATLADSATLYFGNHQELVPSSVSSYARMYVPKAGTIKAVYIYWYIGTPATPGMGENVSCYISKNLSDTLVESKEVSAQTVLFSNTGLNVSVAAGDYLLFKVVCPTFSYNPLNVKLSGVVYIE